MVGAEVAVLLAAAAAVEARAEAEAADEAADEAEEPAGVVLMEHEVNAEVQGTELLPGVLQRNFTCN